MAVLFCHLLGDSACDDVTRSEFGCWVNMLHEAMAVGCKQDRAITAHGLGDEKVSRHGKRGGMELVELKVGDLGTRTQRHCNAVARGYGWVGGVGIELTGTAAGEDDGVGDETAMLSVLFQDIETDDAVAIKYKIASKGVLEYADSGRANGVDKRHLDGEACGVAACMQDARVRVCRFKAASELSVAFVERDAECDEISNARWAFSTEDFDSVKLTEASACFHRVSNVRCYAVFIGHRGCNAALGIACVALRETCFGDKRHYVLSAELNSCDKTCDAAAYDDDVLHAASVTMGAGLALSMRSSATRAGVAIS
jgi:hypothetical protein